MLESHLSISVLKKGQILTAALYREALNIISLREKQKYAGHGGTRLVLGRLRHEDSEFKVIHEHTGIYAVFSRTASGRRLGLAPQQSL